MVVGGRAGDELVGCGVARRAEEGCGLAHFEAGGGGGDGGSGE